MKTNKTQTKCPLKSRIFRQSDTEFAENSGLVRIICSICTFSSAIETVFSPMGGNKVPLARLHMDSARNLDVFSRFDAHCLAASGVAHDVASFVLRGPPPVGTGHLLARHRHGQPDFLFIHPAARFQLAVNSLVDLPTGSVVR
jgi:hypothetical protein